MRAMGAFAHLLSDSVTYQPFSCRDSYGDATYGTSQTYKARIVGEQKLVRGFAGSEVVSAHTVYLNARIHPQPLDKVTLSTGLAGSTEATAISPPILGAKRIPDQNGLHHVVLYLG